MRFPMLIIVLFSLVLVPGLASTGWAKNKKLDEMTVRAEKCEDELKSLKIDNSLLIQTNALLST